MLLDWLIYALLVWGLVAALNATTFKHKPAKKPVAWALTIGMFFINIVALTALQILRYKVISDDMGIDIKPRSPFDLTGALIFSWMFYSLLRKSTKTDKPPLQTEQFTPQITAYAQTTQKVEGCLENTHMPHAPLNASNTANNSTTQDAIDEDRIYEEIARELETGATEKGLWTRLFAECGGDEKQTKVLYIKQRAERLISAERLRLAEIAQTQAAEAERLELLRITKDKEKEFLTAVWEGSISKVDQLIREGIKPGHLRDDTGRSAYDLAKERGDQQMVQLLQNHNKLETQRAEQSLMTDFGITFEGERYHFQGYQYDKLADAIKYAQTQKTRNGP